MGRHQVVASSTARVRAALGALPLVATAGAIGVGLVAMGPPDTEAAYSPPDGPVSPAPAQPPAPSAGPLTVLDLTPVAAEPIVPGPTRGSTRDGSGNGGDERRVGGSHGGSSSTPVTRSARSGAGASPASAGRSSDSSEAGSSGGGSGSGGGSSDSGGSHSGGSDSGGSGGGSRGGLLGGVGSVVSSAPSLLSFGGSSPSVLSFGS